MDIATIAGIALSLGAIVGGFLMEGGHMHSIAQGTAGIIVCGGTMGAVFVQFPMAHLLRAGGAVRKVFFAPKVDLGALAKQLVDFAQKARREGIVSLESETDNIKQPFLKKALRLAVDGTEGNVVQEALEVEITHAEHEGEAASKVFEAAGGYAPTVGILGAVLGLIHVMGNLADPSKLGAGIAVAFVATVYGVALANLFCLPMSGKLKTRQQEEMVQYELILVAIVAIINGENPRLVEQKLSGFVGGHAEEGEMKKAA